LKKYLTITLIALSFAKPGFCQQETLFLKTPKKFNPIDSFDYRSKIQYFSAVPANREEYILSVDQSKIEFLYGVPYISAKYNYLKVPVTLTNASEITLRYLSMSCSWQDIYIIDNANLKIFGPSTCYTNFQVILSIMPHQYIERDIIIEVPKKASLAVAFKIGMKLQMELEKVYSIDAKTNQPFFFTPVRQSMIWSNYVMISKWSDVKKEAKTKSY
jgi:hypothetical protein